MRGYFEEPPKWTDARWIWAAVAAVCVVALLGNLAVWLLLRDSDGDSSSTGADMQRGQAQPAGTVRDTNPNSTTPGQEQPESAVADCHARWQQQRQPLRAAQSSLKQWRVHVQAMNELVAGDISFSQATAFWNQTRKGAMHRIMRFEQAVGRYEDAAPECATDTLQTADGTSNSKTAAQDCVLAAVAGDRVLAAAKTAIATWEHHVHDMEMLRNGHMTAAQATQMWQMSWQAGRDELVEYGHASMHALYLRCA
jgi:hypothetical protein